MKKFSAVCSALDNLTAFAVKAVKLSKVLCTAEKLSGRKQKFFSIALSTAENILQISKLLYQSAVFYQCFGKYITRHIHSTAEKHWCFQKSNYFDYFFNKLKT